MSIAKNHAQVKGANYSDRGCTRRSDSTRHNPWKQQSETRSNGQTVNRSWMMRWGINMSSTLHVDGLKVICPIDLCGFRVDRCGKGAGGYG